MKKLRQVIMPEGFHKEESRSTRVAKFVTHGSPCQMISHQNLQVPIAAVVNFLLEIATNCEEDSMYTNMYYPTGY
jgi:hypothetical protein